MVALEGFLHFDVYICVEASMLAQMQTQTSCSM